MLSIYQTLLIDEVNRRRHFLIAKKYSDKSLSKGEINELSKLNKKIEELIPRVTKKEIVELERITRRFKK